MVVTTCITCLPLSLRQRANRELYMKALILIIGDDPVLMRTRAELLRDWQVTTVNSRDAGEALRLRPYDLVILSQTVQEAQARSLIAQAQELRPSPRILAIRSGDSQQLESPTYQVDLNNPGGLRSAVARILEYQTTSSAC
jgi:DNA-binding NtrC family response regulator